MPKPELYVIFMGEKPKNQPDTISLSKGFFVGEKTAIDAEVKVLYQEDENSIISSILFSVKYIMNREKIWADKENDNHSRDPRSPLH